MCWATFILLSEAERVEEIIERFPWEAYLEDSGQRRVSARKEDKENLSSGEPFLSLGPPTSAAEMSMCFYKQLF